MKKFFLTSAFLAMAASAQAATIDLLRDGQLLARISCGDAACEGWTDSGWSSTTAHMFTVHPPSDAHEEAWVGDIAGEDFSGQTNKDETGNPPVNSTAEYILFKLGGGNELATALIRNVSGGAITYTFFDSGQAGGLSHTNSFGEISSVPLPASGLLLGGMLLAGGWAARRRAQA